MVNLIRKKDEIFYGDKNTSQYITDEFIEDVLPLFQDIKPCFLKILISGAHWRQREHLDSKAKQKNQIKYMQCEKINEQGIHKKG